MLALAVNCLGNFSIFGFSIRNILCILIVLVMGWKNGVLVGGTTGLFCPPSKDIINARA